jgi:hypothetical protein
MTATIAPYCPTWSLHAWEPVFWQVARIPSLKLRHLATHVTQRGDAGSGSDRDPLTRGHTLWAGHSTRGDAALAWDWFCDETRGLVGLRDPYAIVTNLRLIDRGGAVLPAFHAALHLSGIVHGLPWTDQVLNALHIVEPALALAA